MLPTFSRSSVNTPLCLLVKPGSSWLKRRSKLLTKGLKLPARLTVLPRAPFSSGLAATISQNLVSSAAPPAKITSPEPGPLGMYIRSLPATLSPFRSLK